MARHTGQNAVIQFAGTTLSVDYRDFSWEESAETVDRSAGADAYQNYLIGLIDGKASITLLIDGTAQWAACGIGTEGTLVLSPEGTATGKPKSSTVATVLNRSRELAYNDVYQMSVEFGFSQGSAPAEGTW